MGSTGRSARRSRADSAPGPGCAARIQGPGRSCRSFHDERRGLGARIMERSSAGARSNRRNRRVRAGFLCAVVRRGRPPCHLGGGADRQCPRGGAEVRIRVGHPLHAEWRSPCGGCGGGLTTNQRHPSRRGRSCAPTGNARAHQRRRRSGASRSDVRTQQDPRHPARNAAFGRPRAVECRRARSNRLHRHEHHRANADGPRAPVDDLHGSTATATAPATPTASTSDTATASACLAGSTAACTRLRRSTAASTGLRRSTPASTASSGLGRSTAGPAGAQHTPRGAGRARP